MKRLFDIFFSTSGLIILFPLFAVVAILVMFDSKGAVLFQQERVGKNFKSFRILKFRTMSVGAENLGPQITVGGDKRVTKTGKILRRYKIDELPQLLNIFIGDMSFVGPRPEVRKYVELYKEDYKKLLQMRPGITDPSSLKYSKEEDVLSLSNNWEDDYINKVLPEKIKLSLRYVDNCNIFTDLKLIFKTIIKV